MSEIPAAATAPVLPLDTPCSPLADGVSHNAKNHGYVLDGKVIRVKNSTQIDGKSQEIAVSIGNNAGIAGLCCSDSDLFL
jgi:hypothetical protein